jgi:hypothetical protein
MFETVRIVSPVSDDNPNGYIVINKDDLTEDHELFVEKPAKAVKAAKATDESAAA